MDTAIIPNTPESILLLPEQARPREPIALAYDTTKQKFIMMFDASAYSRADCHRYVFYLIVKGLNRGTKDYKMEYGTAFHDGLAHYYTHRRHSQSREELQTLKAVATSKALTHFMSPDIEIPEGDYRTPTHLIGCLNQYFEAYALDPIEALVLPMPDGSQRPLVEQRFSVPFYTDDLIEINLSGTIDLVCHYFDQLIIIDHKSTSATSPQWYLKEYLTSWQLMLYSYIFRRLFPHLADSFYGIGTMINGIFLRKTGQNVFQRSDVIHFYDEVIANFERHMTETVTRLAHAFHHWFYGNTEFVQNFTQCQTKFGCPYVGLCTAGALDREAVIADRYVFRRYDPLKFGSSDSAV